LELPEVEPWPEPVHGATLLSDLRQVFERFVILPKWSAEALALWTLHTYAFQQRDVSTYLGLESPEKRCGKTTLLTVLSELVNRPVVAANISSPALFRVIEEMRPRC
jgi:putative DNA primase/helicase